MEDWQGFLSARPIAVLATVGDDGTPHAVPVEVVVEDGRVYCWMHASSVKARNAARTGTAALVAYKGNTYALVRGPARLLNADDPAYARITGAFLAKYEREETYGNDALVEITPDKVVATD